MAVSQANPQIVSAAEIAARLSFERLIPQIAQGFRDFHSGKARVAAITNIDLPEVNGEMHIKPGYMVDGAYLCVKIATCYYDNPQHGLPTRDGAIVLADRTLGRIEAILCDAGRITDMRTAAASAVAVDALALPGPVTLGLVGAGTQAYWHATALKHVRPIERILLWGRNTQHVDRAIDRIGAATGIAVAAGSLDDIARFCHVIVTATPARTPILTQQQVRPGALIVAMGADAAGKRELGSDILEQASMVVADSLAQCRAVGELQWLSISGARPRIEELGAILAGTVAGRQTDAEIIVFDSTGLAFQDVVGATQIVDAMRDGADHA